MTKAKLDTIRLAIKGLFAVWMPILLLLSPELLTAVAATAIMGAFAFSVDVLFRIWDVGPGDPVPPEPPARATRSSRRQSGDGKEGPTSS